MNKLKRWIIEREVTGFIDSKIKESNMSDQTKRWVIGLVNCAISGAATALGSLAAGISLKQGAVIVTMSMGVSLIKWLSQHPLPGGIDPQ